MAKSGEILAQRHLAGAGWTDEVGNHGRQNEQLRAHIRTVGNIASGDTGPRNLGVTRQIVAVCKRKGRET